MKIGYSKTYPILGKDQWEKIWIEDEVTGTEEDARKALYALKKQVENFHYESNKAAEKQLYPERFSTQYEAEIPAVLTDQPITVPIMTPEEKMVKQINEITDVKVLESFKLLASRNEKIKSAYDNRLKQLTA